ncbi:MAG TPA: cupin domain-containing protein [Candidatus Nanoarchaeia archaeon]|nr:cupin domain-containing protein [Candidatus Nanoarchaeia archaeon]
MEVRKPTKEEKEEALTWPIWEKEETEFPYHFHEKETCLILAGHAQVKSESGDTVKFKAGDLVVFPKGLKCTWKILKPIRKYYKFG